MSLAGIEQSFNEMAKLFRDSQAELAMAQARVKELHDQNVILRERLERYEGRAAQIERVRRGLGKGEVLPVRPSVQAQDRF